MSHSLLRSFAVKTGESAKRQFCTQQRLSLHAFRSSLSDCLIVDLIYSHFSALRPIQALSESSFFLAAAAVDAALTSQRVESEMA